MSNGEEWRVARKFPGYEVSRNELVRHIKSKRLVSQRVDLFDSERRCTVVLVRKEFPVQVFVKEIVYHEFPELRGSGEQRGTLYSRDLHGV